MALINCPECGGEVSDKADVCIHCGYNIRTFIKRNNLIEEKEKYNQMQQEKVKLQKQRNKDFINKYFGTKKKKRLSYLFVFILSIIICIFSYLMIILNRYTFNTIDDMKEFLSGTWGEKDNLTEIIFNGNSASIVYKAINKDITSIVEYHPQKGYFIFLKTKYIINKKGNIKGYGYKYWKLSDSTENPVIKEDKKLKNEDIDKYINSLICLTDDFKEVNYYFSDKTMKLLNTGDHRNMCDIGMYFYISRKDNNLVLRNVLKYKGGYWLFFDSVEIKTGGKIYNIPITKGDKEKDVLGGGDVLELYDTKASQDIIDISNELTANGEGTIRFSGNKTYTYEFTTDDITAIKDVNSVYQKILN